MTSHENIKILNMILWSHILDRAWISSHLLTHSSGGAKFRIESPGDEKRLIAKYLVKTASSGGQCLVCQNNYVRFQHCKRHFIRAHTEPHCASCQMDFHSVQDYMAHRRDFHGYGTNYYTYNYQKWNNRNTSNSNKPHFKKNTVVLTFVCQEIDRI